MTRLALLLMAGLSAVAAADQPPPPVPPPLPLPRGSCPIGVDGDLSDPGWKGAAVVDTFFETVFGDNRMPSVTTVAWLAYDDRYLYIAVRCDDPDPRKIRAPYVDRDQVIGTDDNVAVFLDTRNDRRTAQEFRVSPRGIQADGVFNDASGNEDFSPDVYYAPAGRITEKGWQAEMRIPLSSLRYPRADPQKWGIIVWRNYPRDFRYAIYSSPQPRGANCLVCLSHELTGLTHLPSSSHLVVAPYASAQDVAQADAPGQPLGKGQTDKRVGLDGQARRLHVHGARHPGPRRRQPDPARPDGVRLRAPGLLVGGGDRARAARLRPLVPGPALHGPGERGAGPQPRRRDGRAMAPQRQGHPGRAVARQRHGDPEPARRHARVGRAPAHLARPRHLVEPQHARDRLVRALPRLRERLPRRRGLRSPGRLPRGTPQRGVQVLPEGRLHLRAAVPQCGR